jgi:RimJ/RimL family protein N-acetyltransferase
MSDTAERQVTARSAAPAAGVEIARSRRIRLRQLSYGDIPWLSRLYAQPQARMLQLDDCPTRFFEVAALVAWVNQIYAKHRGLGIWRADVVGGEFLGTFSLMPLEATAEVEISARLTAEAWGRWYVIEGGRLLCRHAFVTLGLPRLAAHAHPDNEAVARVLERLGFHETASCTYAGKAARRFELAAAEWGAAEAAPARA